MPALPEVKGFIETSFVDWPGKVASVVFLPRCNFACPYCHNHRLVTDPESYRTFDLAEIFEKIEKLRDWIDGVVVSGGEPTIHRALPDFLRLFKERNWPVKLDTNGSNPGMVRSLIDQGLVSALSIDVKAPLEELPYRRNAGRGADPSSVEETLKIVAKSKIPCELRATVHRDLLSLPEMKRIVGQTSRIMGGCAKIKWQLCQVSDTLDPSLGTSKNLSREEFDLWVEEVCGTK